MKNTTDIVKNLREANHYTQVEVAGVLGISQQLYSKYESGKYEFPVRHIVKLAEIYKVSADYLLGLSDYPGNFTKLNSSYIDNLSVGQLLDRLMAFDDKNRSSVVDYIQYLDFKAKAKAKKNK